MNNKFRRRRDLFRTVYSLAAAMRSHKRQYFEQAPARLFSATAQI